MKFWEKANSVTNVKTIVKTLVDHWGSGKIKLGKSKFYEQVNLQLSIKKSKKLLTWEPTIT